MVWPLGDDFDLRRREIGIGIHGHPLKRQDSTDRDECGQHQYQEPLSQRRLDYSVDHSVVVDTILARVPGTLFKVPRSGQRCREFANCRNKLPFPITWSPAFSPLVISVCPFKLSPSVTERLPNWFGGAAA